MTLTVGVIHDVCKALKEVFPENYVGILHGDVEAKPCEITSGFPAEPFENFMLDMWDEDPNKIREHFFEFVENAYWGAE